jgi:L,D-transpeptidase ErfK/SrfK
VEEYQVQKGDSLPRLAQLKGIRLQVLIKQNKLKNANKLAVGSTLKINNTHIVPSEVDHGLVVNLPELLLYQFDSGSFRRHYSLAAGQRDWETPTGNYRILSKVKNPTWTVPESIQEEMEEKGLEVVTKVPPGPKNPLGAFWMATSAPGVGLHATTRPGSIGHFASHGCLRMLPQQIEELFAEVPVGIPVKIIYKPFKVALTPENRIYLEVHHDYYGRVPDISKAVDAFIKEQCLESQVDWPKVHQVVKAREGIAVNITRRSERDTVMSQIMPIGECKSILENSPGKDRKPVEKKARNSDMKEVVGQHHPQQGQKKSSTPLPGT